MGRGSKKLRGNNFYREHEQLRKGERATQTFGIVKALRSQAQMGKELELYRSELDNSPGLLPLECQPSIIRYLSAHVILGPLLGSMILQSRKKERRRKERKKKRNATSSSQQAKPSIAQGREEEGE
jgi:hypothetical protein